jgi:hypothetical protein
MRVLFGAALVGCAVAARQKTTVSDGRLSQNVGHDVVQSRGFGKTVEGCTCLSECGASITQGFTCDLCTVARGCGRGNFVTGFWDYCVYAPEAPFESQSFGAKIAYYERELAVRPEMTIDFPSMATVLLGNFKSSLHTTFDNFMPTMPEGREKFIHTGGSVCRIDMTLRDSPYTGLLATGTQKGFVRMGPAATPGDDGMTPGWGFKFPRTGVVSGDFVAMHSVQQDQPFNFFANNISNKLPPPEGPIVLLAKIFERATICAGQVGISDLSKYSQAGRSVATPRFPYKLFFQPSANAHSSDSAKTVDQLMEEFARFPVGMKLFTVYACDTPTADEAAPPKTLDNCGSPKLLGEIKLASKCSVSDFGDRNFHIRHQRIEEDWALRPDFKTGPEACGRSARDWNKGSPELCEGAMLNSDA